ncbi:MAG: hypothetical protein VKJ06_07930 [Vampirovibrionales bacterium]|nr:hypothetical protein [Vampirovibrionales bacterium]
MHYAQLTIDCPAKLNLVLHVGKKILSGPKTGYHRVETLMATLALADTLTVDVEPAAHAQFELHCNGIAIETPAQNNLVTRAYRALLPELPPLAITATLSKKIPVQAGLGGGSSNAAAMLVALNTLAQLPQQTLLARAQTLGADVPFFVHSLLNQSALSHWSGLGDSLHRDYQAAFFTAQTAPEPLNALTHDQIIIVKPHDAAVATPEAYQWLDAVKTNAPAIDACASVIHALERQAPLAEWPVCNDFQGVVRQKNPDIQSAMKRLRDLGCKPVLLCGSGAAVAGLMSPLLVSLDADQLANALPKNEFWHCVTHIQVPTGILSHTPLHVSR